MNKIPKIIHYCWFGPKPIPTQTKKCIDSWKKYFPDYTFMFWNEQNSPIDHPFPHAAYQAKKYAFVADYVRTWALYKYGGIYFDTDVIVIKNFAPILDEVDVFMAYEQPEKTYINVAIWGAIKESQFINDIFKYYTSIDFNKNTIFNLTIPTITTTIYKKYKGNDIIKVFDYDFFYPFPQKKRRSRNYNKYITQNTYAVHLWDFSWLTISERINYRINKIKHIIKKILNTTK